MKYVYVNLCIIYRTSRKQKTKLKSNETEKQEHSKKEGVITCYGMTIRPSYSTDTQSFDMYRCTVAQYRHHLGQRHAKGLNVAI